MQVNGKALNDNEKYRRLKNNDNEGVKRKAKLCSDIEAEAGAERYIKTLNAPECREFFLKVMYHLPYETRERLLSMAIRPSVTRQKNYFTYCAKKELAKLGF